MMRRASTRSASEGQRVLTRIKVFIGSTSAVPPMRSMQPNPYKSLRPKCKNGARILIRRNQFKFFANKTTFAVLTAKA
jgi:hypothetical protein